jgi:hypothetical protein
MRKKIQRLAAIFSPAGGTPKIVQLRRPASKKQA